MIKTLSTLLVAAAFVIPTTAQAAHHPNRAPVHHKHKRHHHKRHHKHHKPTPKPTPAPTPAPTPGPTPAPTPAPAPTPPPPLTSPFAMWGNDTACDCPFAAAADWEILVGDNPPLDEAELIREFYAAGGTEGGLRESELDSYWSEYGILGIVEHDHAITQSQAIADQRPLIAGLTFQPGQHFDGQLILERGGHEVAVRQVTESYVELVTWGVVITIPLREWDEYEPEYVLPTP